MSLVQAIDALIEFVEDHWRTPDYGDRLYGRNMMLMGGKWLEEHPDELARLEEAERSKPNLNDLDTAVYVEARQLGLQDSDLPRKDATLGSAGHVFFGRTNVPGCWSSPPDGPSTVMLMCAPGWKADMLALRALAENFMQPAPVAIEQDQKDPSAFILVGKLWRDRSEFKRASDVTKFLDKIPNEPAPAGIRYQRNGQRRYVHAADWYRYFAEKDRKASEALDAEGLQEFLADQVARQAQERERKRGK
jgi:hypothetical protein